MQHADEMVIGLTVCCIKTLMCVIPVVYSKL